MANIEHSILAGTEIHEPKGVADASLGQVYVADGVGSGNWASVGTSSFTGMIADFAWPEVQDGWLECDGTDINITTYASLFAVMTIQQNGTRTASSAVITSLTSTTNMKVGYYVYGTGIAEDTTILSIDSATQITMSAAASSTGTTTVIVSPWRLGNGVIRLPDARNRYKRAQTTNTRVGQLQDPANLSHNHTGSGTTSVVSNDHTHSFSGTSGTMNSNQTHFHTNNPAYVKFASASSPDANYFVPTDAGFGLGSMPNTTPTNTDHTHNYSGTTTGISANHTHTYNFTSSDSGDTESRPYTIIFKTCVKT